MSADPALTAALAADGSWPFGAVRLALPAATLRLLDGSSQTVIDGETYSGEDAEFGVLLVVEPVEENLENDAPELRVVLQPNDAAAAATLADADMQGSEVIFMVGCIDPSTGLPIGQPEVPFLGEVDVPSLSLGEGTRQVEFRCVSADERMFEMDEGERISDAYHQSICPGELGFSMLATLLDPAYWGAVPPAGATAPAPYVPGGTSDPYGGGYGRYA